VGPHGGMQLVEKNLKMVRVVLIDAACVRKAVMKVQ